jgi:hypothetical protein
VVSSFWRAVLFDALARNAADILRSATTEPMDFILL